MSPKRILIIVPEEPRSSDPTNIGDWRRPMTMRPRVMFGWSTSTHTWFSWKWRTFGLHLQESFTNSIPVDDVTFLREVDNGMFGVRALHCVTHARGTSPVVLSEDRAVMYYPKDGDECCTLIARHFDQKLAERIKRQIPTEAIWQPGFTVRFRVGDTRHDADVTGFSICPWSGVIRVVAENTDAFFNGVRGVSFLRRKPGENFWTWVVSGMEMTTATDQDGTETQILMPLDQHEEHIPLDHVIFQVPGDRS